MLYFYLTGASPASIASLKIRILIIQETKT